LTTNCIIFFYFKQNLGIFRLLYLESTVRAASLTVMTIFSHVHYCQF